MPERPDLTEGRFRPFARMLGLMDNAVETTSRRFDDTGYSPITGRVDLSYVESYRDLTITQLGCATRQTPVAGLTGLRRGIYTVAANGDLTLVARTGLQTTSIYAAANTEYLASLNTTGGFPASYRLEVGRLYAFAHFITFTTTAPVLRGYGANTPPATLARAPRLSGLLAGQSDLPTSIPAASVAAPAGVLSVFATP